MPPHVHPYIDKLGNNLADTFCEIVQIRACHKFSDHDRITGQVYSLDQPGFRVGLIGVPEAVGDSIALSPCVINPGAKR